MSKFICINENGGWSGPTGIFECIVEETRKLFTDGEQKYVQEIYQSLDEQFQSFIVLDYVDETCFNLFYNHCKKAMDRFPDSERGSKIREKPVMPLILQNWAELLRIMRDDPRYRTEKK